MAFERKPSQNRDVRFNTDFPAAPNAETEKWWSDVKSNLKQDHKTIEDAYAALKAQIAALDSTALISALAERVAILEGTALPKPVHNGIVSPNARIQESKLALNYPTHPNANDPTDGQKAALVGTYGAPGSENRYVTAEDPRVRYYAEVPAGTVISFAGPATPSGYLECDGSTVNRSDYYKLFLAIGETFGAGDGIKTFVLPDARGRVIMAAGQGADLTLRALGEALGTEEHTLTAAQSGLPAHSHTVPWMDNSCASGSDNDTGSMTSSPDQNIATSTVTAADAAEAHPNIQPSLVLRVLIKY